MYHQSMQYGYKFDGKRGIVVHAHNLDVINLRRESHIDDDEDWSYSSKSSDRVSLFPTLIHEIGYARGISDSDLLASVMFAYNNGKTELSDDILLAFQNLYGKSINTILLPPLQL